MKVRIQATFDMTVESTGEFHTDVSFILPDYPETPCPDSVKALVIGEIKMICGTIDAARSKLFSENKRS